MVLTLIIVVSFLKIGRHLTRVLSDAVAHVLPLTAAKSAMLNLLMVEAQNVSTRF